MLALSATDTRFRILQRTKAAWSSQAKKIQNENMMGQLYLQYLESRMINHFVNWRIKIVNDEQGDGVCCVAKQTKDLGNILETSSVRYMLKQRA